MLGDHRIGLWDVTLVMLVVFILFGHKLPGMMRTIGREGLQAAQYLPIGERRTVLFTYLRLRLFMTGVVLTVGGVCLVLVISGFGS